MSPGLKRSAGLKHSWYFGVGFVDRERDDAFDNPPDIDIPFLLKRLVDPALSFLLNPWDIESVLGGSNISIDAIHLVYNSNQIGKGIIKCTKTYRD